MKKHTELATVTKVKHSVALTIENDAIDTTAHNMMDSKHNMMIFHQV